MLSLGNFLPLSFRCSFLWLRVISHTCVASTQPNTCEYPSVDCWAACRLSDVQPSDSSHLTPPKLQSRPVNSARLLAPRPVAWWQCLAVPAVKLTLSVSLLTKIAVQGCFVYSVSGGWPLRDSWSSFCVWPPPLWYPPRGTPATWDSLNTSLYVLKSLSPLCSAWVFPLPLVTQNMCPLRSQSDSLFLCVIYYLKLAVHILSGVLVVHGIGAHPGLVRLSGQIWKCELLYF